MNLEELIAAATKATGMSEDMVRRSAEARAEAKGRPVEEVLAEWGGIDLATGKPKDQVDTGLDDQGQEGDAEPAGADDAPAPPAAEVEPETIEPTPEAKPAADEDPAPAAVSEEPEEPEEAGEQPDAAPAAEPAPTAAAATGAVSMDDLLAAAAEKMGMPASMVQRSAGARAKAEGMSVEQVVAEWAGIDLPEGAAVSGEGAGSESAPAAGSPAAAPAEASEADVEVLGEDEGEPEEPIVSEAEESEAEREIVPAGAIPRWLAALFVVVPLFAVAYVGFLPNGPNCGDAGRLEVDPVAGVAVNCDGSAYGEEEFDFFGLGSEIYERVGCIACHGAGGAGSGNFPAFIDGALLSTFPDGACADHKEWVTLGTNGWPETTYGATNKLVGGSGAVMPPFASLTPQELASVVIYERVQFGGLDLGAAIADCAPPGELPPEEAPAASG